MAEKLVQYDTSLCNDMSKMAQILGPRLGCDIMEESVILLRNVVFSSLDKQSNRKPLFHLRQVQKSKTHPH